MKFAMDLIRCFLEEQWRQLVQRDQHVQVLQPGNWSHGYNRINKSDTYGNMMMIWSERI